MLNATENAVYNLSDFLIVALNVVHSPVILMHSRMQKFFQAEKKEAIIVSYVYLFEVTIRCMSDTFFSTLEKNQKRG